MGEPMPVGGSGTNSRNTNTLGRRKSRKAPQPPSRNAIHPVERLLEELAIRNPSELVIGIAKTVATQWRHQPQHLLRPGVCYEAQYLGSTLVRHVRGTESTKRSIQKLKKKKAEDAAGNKATGIVLAISLSGVQFLDPFNQVRTKEKQTRKQSYWKKNRNFTNIRSNRPCVVLNFPRNTRVAGQCPTRHCFS